MLASCIILHTELLVLVGNIRSAELMSYFNFLPATSSLCLTNTIADIASSSDRELRLI